MERIEGPATSTVIAEMLDTNASFVRRTMAGLREQGWVVSTRGHGGGWRLAVPLADIALLELYDALGSPALFAVGRSDDAARCLMERAANQGASMSEAEEFWEARYAGGSPESSGRPSGALVRFVADRRPGRAVDVGCARGDDVVWLAKRGWTATGVHVSETVLGYARANAASARRP